MPNLRIFLIWATIALLLTGVSDTSFAEEIKDEAGKIEPGLFWNYITAAYVVTWLTLIGYTFSLWIRQHRGTRT